MCAVYIIIHTFDLKGEITHTRTADVRKRRYVGVVRWLMGFGGGPGVVIKNVAQNDWLVAIVY